MHFFVTGAAQSLRQLALNKLQKGHFDRAKKRSDSIAFAASKENLVLERLTRYLSRIQNRHSGFKTRVSRGAMKPLFLVVCAWVLLVPGSSRATNDCASSLHRESIFPHENGEGL